MPQARIKEIRLSKPMTLDELAAASNMDNANIARLESGNTNPTIRTLYKISRGLKVKLKELTLNKFISLFHIFIQVVSVYHKNFSINTNKKA